MSIVYRTPGGWFGNDPGFLPSNPKAGNVVVDSKHIAPALAWLSRRARIISTHGEAGYPNSDAVGVVIQYEVRR